MQTTTTYTLDPVRDLTESGTAYELRFHFAVSPDTDSSSSVTVTIPSFYAGLYDLNEDRDVAQIVRLLDGHKMPVDATDDDTRILLTKAIERSQARKDRNEPEA
jgi:hypothetical protein